MIQLCSDTIQTVCTKDYTPTEINAWITGSENKQRWLDLIAVQYVVITVYENTIVGFGSLDKGEYIDMFYIHKNYQRQGIANTIYDALEKEAFRTGTSFLYSNVSKTALPFFEKKGFQIIREQQVERQGVKLINFKMAKQIYKTMDL